MIRHIAALALIALLAACASQPVPRQQAADTAAGPAPGSVTPYLHMRQNFYAGVAGGS